MQTILVQPGENALQSAIDSLPRDDSPVTLHLAPGTYREKITLNRPNTTLEGEDAASTVIIWADGANEMMPDGLKRGTFRSYTMLMDADHVTLRRLSIVNAAAPREKVGQAVALYADGDFFTCEDCVLSSFQDTLFTAPLPPKEIQKNGFLGPKQFAPRRPQRHTYRRCRISGDIDFIFGGAAAWFEDCDIICVDGREDRTAPGGGFATAASTPEGQKYGYVFYRCRFLGEGVEDGSFYLGRPWRDWAKTVLLDCVIGPHIRPEGWDDWGKPHAREVSFYAEHGCTGPGSEGQRAAWAHRLTDGEAAAITYEDFMRSL
ncbi:MAG: pectinesterase family protein [Eubacteriales bacterium]|nr:pectinesterase family protein [Eubacteriales bacterium]